MKKWYKEPLLHFLLIGAFVFVLFLIVNKEEDFGIRNKIVVSAADIKRLSDNWSRKWNRPPTKNELKGLVDAYIKEEVYYREALALGLDKNDTILKRRLMQKMEFLSNDLAELNTPDDSTLNKYFRDNQEKYELPPLISFTHIYFSADKRGAKAFEDAEKVLSGLNVTRAPERGDSFMMEYDFVQQTSYEVERLFGKDFTSELFKLKTDMWQGPIKSAYGFHLVRILEKIEARSPEFTSVIDEVRTDWMFEQRQKMNDEMYEMFKKRYEIIVEELPNHSEMAISIRSQKDTS